MKPGCSPVLGICFHFQDVEESQIPATHRREVRIHPRITRWISSTLDQGFLDVKQVSVISYGVPALVCP